MADIIIAADAKEALFFPFNAVPLLDENGNGVTDEHGNPRYDRAFDAEDFAAFYKLFISDGVYPNPSDNLQVRSLYNNMTVTVSPGTAMLAGHGYWQKNAVDVRLEPAHATLNRLDSFLIRVDHVQRKPYLVYRVGTPAGTPASEPPIRDDDYSEIKLADIPVPPRATTVNPRDTRLDKNVCGIVSQMVTTVDTTTLFEQYDTYFSEQIINWDAIREALKAAWEAQTNFQRDDYAGWKTAIESTINGWKDMAIIELAKVVSFCFENQAALPGTVYTFDDSTADTIIEELRYAATNALFARQTTSFKADGSIEELQTVYNTDGSIFRNVLLTTTFPNGKTTNSRFRIIWRRGKNFVCASTL